MPNPLINILIRTMSGRERLLAECLNSVAAQTYKNRRTIVFKDPGTDKSDFHYNLFCNEMKAKINEGWFFFLDDDDFLHGPGALERIAVELTNENEAVLCQFLRGGVKLKPSGGDIRNRFIKSGQVGLPCILLHWTYKNIADVQACDNGDYLYIADVAARMPVKFVEKVLVNSPKRSYGL